VHVTVDLKGEGTYELELPEPTYADLLAEVGVSPQEVAVLVDGRPVPEDGAVEADHVTVVRLIKGG